VHAAEISPLSNCSPSLPDTLKKRRDSSYRGEHGSHDGLCDAAYPGVEPSETNYSAGTSIIYVRLPRVLPARITTAPGNVDLGLSCVDTSAPEKTRANADCAGASAGKKSATPLAANTVPAASSGYGRADVSSGALTSFPVAFFSLVSFLSRLHISETAFALHALMSFLTTGVPAVPALPPFPPFASLQTPV
jgi:hypothetical protein